MLRVFRIVLWAAAGAATLLFGFAVPVFAQTCVSDDAGPFGSLIDADEFGQAVQALPPAALMTPPVQPPLPSQAFLTNLPAVAQQGTPASPGAPGSCEAQSFGYGLGSYTAARRPDGSSKWIAALPQNSISAAYLFSWGISKGYAQCSGGPSLIYLNHLVGFGAPTRARVPYEPECSYFETTIPQERGFPDDYPDMKRFRIGSYATFNISQDPQKALQLIKSYIANGQAVAFSGYVLCGYEKNLSMQDGVIYETSYIINSKGKPDGHGQFIVGYDENVGTPGNQGALLVQNSFGTAWPASAGAIGSAAPPGMAYWSYNSFLQTQKLAAVAYPRAAGPPTGVMLSGSSRAPLASISRAFQWAPDGSATYLILTHFFHEPVTLSQINLTEPGGRITATGGYGQNISTGYSYLQRNDGHAFISGTWSISLQGNDMNGDPVSYTGAVEVAHPQPNSPSETSMAGQQITDSTGSVVLLSP